VELLTGQVSTAGGLALTGSARVTGAAAPTLVDVTVLRYSLLRIMLLFGCMLVLWLVGVRDPVWLLLATAVSSVALSYVVLRGPREELARQLAARVEQRTARRHNDADDEDREIERRAGDDPPGTG
jgi:uncharacterized protein DUF4229